MKKRPMNRCSVLDLLVTPFIDGECTPEERSTVVAHLSQCASCRERVEAESTASHVLHAHAAVARTMGVDPSWRPRVWRLGRPALPHPAALLVAGMIIAGTGLWLRPATVSAVGVIGDSFCGHQHRFTTRFNVDDRTCTLGCVARGAQFVLVLENRIYPIRNQDLPELASFANRRVEVTGAMAGDAIAISSLVLSE